jgi:hypothetical protein
MGANSPIALFASGAPGAFPTPRVGIFALDLSGE